MPRSLAARCALPLACVGLLAFASAAGGEDAPERVLDPDSPTAKALGELLAVDPRYARDGTVDLDYRFRRPEELADFAYEGFDDVDRGRKGKRRKKRAGKGRTLHLIAGSQRQGLCLHRLPLKGSYEVEVTARVRRMSTRATLVFVCGKAGVRWGSQLVRRSGGGWKPIAGEPSRKAFEGHAQQTFRIRVRGPEVVVFHQGREVVRSDALDGKTSGRVGFFLQDVDLLVERLKIRGTVDPKGL
ncbi:MAG: hypothetical protein D6731_07580 [Planctomycetota bacterium]|nr:MAG: hypothetical protein D6731_07580 [Planctomycetota bacterium]